MDLKLVSKNYWKFGKMSLLRNLTKFRSIQTLIPANYYPARFQSSCVDKKNSPERRKFKAMQARMQRDIHAPVFLIMGTRDKILFYITVGTVFIGVLMSFQVIYRLSKRPV